jgi:hypothetical protein
MVITFVNVDIYATNLPFSEDKNLLTANALLSVPGLPRRIDNEHYDADLTKTSFPQMRVQQEVNASIFAERNVKVEVNASVLTERNLKIEVNASYGLVSSPATWSVQFDARLSATKAVTSVTGGNEAIR